MVALLLFSNIRYERAGNKTCPYEITQIIMKNFLYFLLAINSLQSFAATKLPTPAVQNIDIAYLSQELAPPTEMLSNLDPFIANKGVEGAELAISDNNTTGQFTHQNFILHKFNVPPAGNVADVFKQNIATKFHYVITNLNAAKTLEI